ncbi:MAG: hypothetical protein IH977_09065 [Nitrospinae bacterium]|nr:hypothetical protein [Nitrospinota bacterium]
MVRRRNPATVDHSHVPPDPNEVLPYWRWYYEVVLWPAAPKTFQAFWKKVESCGLLKVHCETLIYGTEWKHALLYHLGEMWSIGSKRGRLEPEVLETNKRGRPKQLQAIAWNLGVLDLIVHGLLGPTDLRRRPSKHWKLSVNLLKHFFPEKWEATWNRANLKASVNLYLRKHRLSDSLYNELLTVLSRSTYLTSDKYRQDMQTHLSR